MSTRRVSRKSTAGSTARTASRASRGRAASAHDSAMEDVENDQQEKDEEGQEEATPQQEGEQREGEGEEESAAATPKPRSKKSSRTSTQQTTSTTSSHHLTHTVESDDHSLGEDTPTRLTRLDEKSELQGLNKRLEFYILKQRERDASQDAWGRELNNLKNKHAADLEHQKNLFENQLALVRKNRDELSAKLSKLEGESAQSVHVRDTQCAMIDF